VIATSLVLVVVFPAGVLDIPGSVGRLYNGDRDHELAPRFLFSTLQRPHLHSRGLQLAARPLAGRGNRLAERLLQRPTLLDRLRHW